jgi:WD40 repeat protein/serine/threonine protein kinase
MTNASHCSQCGQALPDGWPKGLCQHCALTNALEVSGGESQLLMLGTQSSGDGEQPPMPTPRLFGSRAFGDYELLEELGRGGMGVVYRARQVSLNRSVAVKLILSGEFASKQEVLRFRGEAEAAANLHHPNIVAIYETGEIQGQNYFSMEYVQGRTLAEVVRDSPLRPDSAARYVRIVAEAIHYAHGRGILHRDLKPSNVLIDAEDRPRVTDFGLARRLRGEFGITVTGQALGSPSFMPPEQTTGKSARVGPPSDVYGMGAILYHLLTGRPPFQAETIQGVLRQLHEREPVAPRLLNTSVPPDLETICLKCLAKEPEKPYPTALALAQDLGRFERDEPISARPANQLEKTWRWCRRKPAIASLLGATTALFLLVAIGSPIALLRITAARSESERNLYVDNIHLANDALEAHDLARARLLLGEIDKSSVQRRMRGWEWRYLAGRCRGDELGTLWRHDAPVAGLAVSPDGRWLSGIGDDGAVRLWDFDHRMLTNSWPAHTNAYRLRPGFLEHNLIFTADSANLITTSPDRFVRLWSVPSGRLQAEVALPNPAMTLAVSPDGRLLVAGTSGGQLTVLSLLGGSPVPLETWRTSIELLWGLRFSPDGRTLFVGGIMAQAVERFDLTDPTHPQRLPDIEDSSGPLAFSPDGRWLVAAKPGVQRLCVWELPTLKIVATNNAALEDSRINRVEFSPDSRVLAAGLISGRIFLWKIDEPNSEPVTLLGHEGDLRRLAFSRDGHTLASSSYSDRTVRIWDAAVRERGKWTFHLDGAGNDLNFSADSKHLVSVSHTTAMSASNAPEPIYIVKLWTVDEKQGLLPLTAFTNHTSSLAFSASFSPDSSIIAVHDYQELFLLRVPTLTIVTQATASLPCYGPGGRWMIYAETEKIRRTDSPFQPATLVAQEEGQIYALAVSPDGQTLASCAANEDYVIKLRDILTGRRIGDLPGHQAWVNRLAFSPDGMTLASAGWDDGWLGLWDVRHQRKRALLRAHNGAVFKVAFSPDGSTLATCGDDATLRLWNVTQQREIAVLPTHGGSVNGIGFSPDGHWLACASVDGTIHLWRAPSLLELTESANAR